MQCCSLGMTRLQETTLSALVTTKGWLLLLRLCECLWRLNGASTSTWYKLCSIFLFPFLNSCTCTLMLHSGPVWWQMTNEGVLVLPSAKWTFCFRFEPSKLSIFILVLLWLFQGDSDKLQSLLEKQGSVRSNKRGIASCRTWCKVWSKQRRSYIFASFMIWISG
jgi:hypothetical protein